MYGKIIKAITTRIRAVLIRCRLVKEPVVTFRPVMPTSPCAVPKGKKKCGVQGSVISTVDDKLQRICLKCACRSSVQHLIEELKLYELHKTAIHAERKAQYEAASKTSTIVAANHGRDNPFLSRLKMSGAPDK